MPTIVKLDYNFGMILLSCQIHNTLPNSIRSCMLPTLCKKRTKLRYLKAFKTIPKRHFLFLAPKFGIKFKTTYNYNLPLRTTAIVHFYVLHGGGLIEDMPLDLGSTHQLLDKCCFNTSSNHFKVRYL